MQLESKSAEAINLQLRVHQDSVKGWAFGALVQDLHCWADRMRLAFKLHIGTPALMIDPLRTRYLGHYRMGRNAFGIKDEIAIDRHHAEGNPYWQVLGTLLHELLHAWQEQNGDPPSRKSKNYHNRQYRDKAMYFGLIVDRYGHTRYAPGNTPFLNLLRKYGVKVPDLPEPESPAPRAAKTKLKLYACPCGVKVRVGRSRFNAKCLDCSGLFEKK